MGNIRPLIPLAVDPPGHAKYRKILDPLFTPKRMEAIEAAIAERANHFLDPLSSGASASTTTISRCRSPRRFSWN